MEDECASSFPFLFLYRATTMPSRGVSWLTGEAQTSDWYIACIVGYMQITAVSLLFRSLRRQEIYCALLLLGYCHSLQFKHYIKSVPYLYSMHPLPADFALTLRGFRVSEGFKVRTATWAWSLVHVPSGKGKPVCGNSMKLRCGSKVEAQHAHPVLLGHIAG